MICSKCGTQNPDGVNFCAACGAPLANAPSPEQPAAPGAPVYNQPNQPPVYNQPPVNPQQPPFAAPVYGQPQPAPKKKKKTALIVGGGIAGVVVLAIVLLVVAVYISTADERALVGEWKATVDMTDYLQEEMSQLPEFGSYMEVTDFSFVVYYTFYDDYTYKASVDEDSVNTAMENVKADLKDALYAYAEDVMRQNGLNMPAETMFALSGTSVDEIIEEAFSAESMEDIADEFFNEGNFEADDGKLYLSDGYDYAVDPNSYETYELSDNQLVLTSGVDPEFDEEDLAAYPITFEKVAA